MSAQTQLPESRWVFLAIIAVDKADRVQCQCNGCGKGIFAAIHMVALPDNEIQCWGSDCYAYEAGLAHVSAMKPMFPFLNGRRLTEAEREQLRSNRQRLVEQFKAQHEAELLRLEEARQADAVKGGKDVRRNIDHA
jgi:hypothetical protein